MDCLDDSGATLALYEVRGHFAVVLVHRSGARVLKFAQDSVAAVTSLYDIAGAAAARGIILEVQEKPVEVLAA